MKCENCTNYDFCAEHNYSDCDHYVPIPLNKFERNAIEFDKAVDKLGEGGTFEKGLWLV